MRKIIPKMLKSEVRQGEGLKSVHHNEYSRRRVVSFKVALWFWILLRARLLYEGIHLLPKLSLVDLDV